MEEEIDVTTTDNQRLEAEDADVNVDVECGDPESTHPSALPLHYKCYSSPTNRDGQNNIKDFNEEDVVQTATDGTNENETDKINNSTCCTVYDFKRDDGKQKNLRFVVGDTYVLTKEGDEFHVTNNKEREDLEADSTRELQNLRVGQGTGSPPPAEQSSLPGILLGQTPLESREDRLTCRGESIPISPSDQHSQPGEQPSSRELPGPHPVIRLSNFSISHILKPNFGKNRREKECGAFSKHIRDKGKANESDLPVDYGDTR